MGIFINKLTIQNYKCYENESVVFGLPNGEPGSGLSILIGENGNGKTAVLEAVSYLTLSSYSAENKLSISDFNDFQQEIVIEAETDAFNCRSSIEFYNSWSFESEGVLFKAKSRSGKERGKVLSSPFDTHSYFRLVRDQYKKGDGSVPHTGGAVKNVDGRDKLFSNPRIDDEDGLNIFFFDKNRTRQLTTGNYRTTFERICDDLNWKFLRNLKREDIPSIAESVSENYFKVIEKVAAKNLGPRAAEDLREFFDAEQYGRIRIELMNLLHPFSNAFLALRNEEDMTQINVKDLGSGIEIILTLLMLKNIASEAKGSIVYLIDEPELHLHPKAQESLLELLMEESRDKQIVVSTHSPYLFKGAISRNASLLLFTRNGENKIEISDARDKGWGLFPSWSPSWGEVNYFAYEMPTIEFHDELYGFLHQRYVAAAEDQCDADNRSKLSVFETGFLQSMLPLNRKWTPEYVGRKNAEMDVTLPTFIRNKVHHPENKTMGSSVFSNDELKSSIKALVSLVKNPE